MNQVLHNIIVSAQHGGPRTSSGFPFGFPLDPPPPPFTWCQAIRARHAPPTGAVPAKWHEVSLWFSWQSCVENALLRVWCGVGFLILDLGFDVGFKINGLGAIFLRLFCWCLRFVNVTLRRRGQQAASKRPRAGMSLCVGIPPRNGWRFPPPSACSQPEPLSLSTRASFLPLRPLLLFWKLSRVFTLCA